MSIVGGLDIHRQQITFDYLDVDSGQLWRGQISPADRQHLAGWLQRFAPSDGPVALAVEACTGWRYVAEELAAAGVVAHLAEPAETAALRGPKRRAKTDRAAARLLRELLASGRLPACWIPPAHVLECRALLELFHALRTEHTAWVQRVHAVCLHQDTPALGRERFPPPRAGAAAGVVRPAAVAGGPAAGHHRAGDAWRGGRPAGRGPPPAAGLLPPAVWRQGAGAAAVGGRADHRAGAVLLAGRWGPVRLGPQGGPVCRPGHHRVRLGGQAQPGRLSRQGPSVLRWLVYEAGMTHARQAAADHDYYTTVKDRIDGKRAALSQARKLVRRAVHILDELGDQALAWTQP